MAVFSATNVEPHVILPAMEIQSDPHPKVVLISGPNGAGKSTMAPGLLRDTFGLLEFVNADAIALGLSAFQPETASFAAGKVMLKRLNSLANQKRSFAFETTLASRTHITRVQQLVRKGYHCHLLFLWLQSPELAVQRVSERVRIGGHPVPQPVILRRYRGGIRNFFRFYQVLAKSWVVYDNSKVGDPRLVASGIGKSKLQIYQKRLWSTFSKIGA